MADQFFILEHQKPSHHRIKSTKWNEMPVVYEKIVRYFRSDIDELNITLTISRGDVLSKLIKH